MFEKNKYIDILNKVFPLDGIYNNMLLLYNALDCDYIKVEKEGKKVLGFLFADINKKNSQKTDIDYLSYNYNYVLNYMSDNDAYINLIAVDPDFQGKGIGKKLIYNFIQYCKENNINRIFLWSDKSCNNGFYEKLNFRVVCKYSNPYFKDYCNLKDDKNYNSIIYCLELT